MTDLGRPRAVEIDIRMPRDIAGDAHRQAIRRLETKTVAAAGAGRKRRRFPRHLDAIALRLGAQRIDRGAIRGGEMHAEQRGLLALPNGEHVVLAAGGAEMDAVSLGTDLLQSPDPAVELRRLLEIANTELDAANAGDFAVCHDACPLP